LHLLPFKLFWLVGTTAFLPFVALVAGVAGPTIPRPLKLLIYSMTISTFRHTLRLGGISVSHVIIGVYFATGEILDNNYEPFYLDVMVI
jgi:hypothetical protein